jgi:two-component system cell cycle response regulator DivK
LVIDDRLEDLAILVEMLSDEGVTYTAVQNLKGLEDYLSELDNLNVVFLDLDLPGTSGYEIFQIIRGNLHLDVPIIAYTVHQSEASNANRMGFDGFVGKPLDGERFPDQLRRILHGQRVWEPR